MARTTLPGSFGGLMTVEPVRAPADAAHLGARPAALRRLLFGLPQPAAHAELMRAVADDLAHERLRLLARHVLRPAARERGEHLPILRVGRLQYVGNVHPLPRRKRLDAGGDPAGCPEAVDDLGDAHGS